jgi:lipid-binding SYLF domain-containing protein
MTLKSVVTTTRLAIIALTMSTTAFAATEAQIDQRVSMTLHHFNHINSANRSLEDRAAGMLVFPRVTKAGIGVGGEFGEGSLRVNGKTVGYYSLGSASVGLTLGLTKHSEIIMFMTHDALDKFMSSEGWSIGADAGITVISGGATGTFDTQTQQKPILGFIFAEKGLIGDLSLEGSKITKIKN